MGILQKFASGFHRILFYILLVLFPAQLGLHIWTSWTMVLGRRLDYLSPTIYLTDVLIGLLIICWTVGSFRDIRQYVFRMNRKLILVCSVFIFFNIFFAASPPVAISTWIKFFELFLFGVYIVKTKPPFNRIVFFLSLSVLYSAIIAILQFLLQHSLGGALWLLGERTFSAASAGIAQIPLCLPWGSSGCPLVLRPYGTFPHPNVLGGYIAVLLPLIIFNFQFSILNQTKKISMLKIITIILAILALILTFSRSAWVVGVLGIGIWYLVSKRKLHFTFSHIFISFVTALAISIIVPNFLGNSESVVVRKQLNDSAISMIARSPVLGVGLGNFLVKLPETLPSRMVYFLQPVHNIYLIVLSEVGIVGVGLIAYIVFYCLNHESGIMNHGKKRSVQLSIIYYPLAIILLLGFADHYPLTLQQGRLLLTLLLALMLQ